MTAPAPLVEIPCPVGECGGTGYRPLWAMHLLPCMFCAPEVRAREAEERAAARAAWGARQFPPRTPEAP